MSTFVWVCCGLAVVKWRGTVSVQTNHRVEREVAARPVVPRWAKEDWEVTIVRFVESVDDLHADVGKAYGMLTGPPQSGTLGSLEDVWDAICPLLFNPGRLAKFLTDLNPRLIELWKQGTISFEQVQFYVLRLFREAAGRIRGRSLDWLPRIPEEAR
ncbi:MAG: hypothetical protein Q8Q12_19015 [bacterium]|nr:hypothetical protein [bacterium]